MSNASKRVPSQPPPSQNFLLKAIPDQRAAEAATLAAMIVDPTVIPDVMALLPNESVFGHEEHRTIWRVVVGLYETDPKSVDGILVRSKLEALGLLESIGGLDYLRNVVESLVSASAWRYYAKQVRESATRRSLVAVSERISRIAREADDDAEAADQATEALAAVVDSLVSRDQVVTCQDSLRVAFAEIERKQRPALATSFASLAEKIPGFFPGELIVIAGRPGSGKSALVLTMLLRNFLRLETGSRALFVSLEMRASDVMMRALCYLTEIPFWVLRSGELTTEDFKAVNGALTTLRDWGLFLADHLPPTPTAIRNAARKLHQKRPLDVVVVDYAQRLHLRQKRATRDWEMTVISNAMKDLALELNIPVVLLSQLNRACDNREDHRPRLSDLRDSGCVAADTRILTTSGPMPIRDLTQDADRVYCLTQGDRPLVRPATAIWKTGVKPMYEMILSTGHGVVATGNHKFLAFEKSWERLDTLKKGDQVAIPLNFSVATKATMSCAEARLLGLMTANGCALPRRSIQLTLNSEDGDIARKAIADANAIFHRTLRPYSKRETFRTNSHGVVVYFPSKRVPARGYHNPMVVWLRKHGLYGCRTKQKQIPSAIFQQPRAIQIEFLKAIFAGDGTTSIRGAKARPSSVCLAAYSSSSESLACDVQLLLQGVGVVASKRRYSSRGFVCYSLNIEDRQSRLLFAEGIGFLGRRKQATMQKAYRKIQQTRRGWSRFTYAKNMCYVPIKSITPQSRGEAWDATVPEAHNFFANGMVAHNSLEQDADCVLSVFREDCYTLIEPTNVAEIGILKQRHGPLGVAMLTWMPARMGFEESAL